MKPGRLWLVASGLLIALTGQGQALQDSLRHEDDDIVSSIAPYPADVRDAILDVSQYPQKLVKIGRLQARTSQSFQDLVEKYPRDVQEKLYDISRYPNLVNQLVSGDSKKTPDQVKTILAAYPQEIAGSASDLYASHFSDLQSMNKNYQQSEEALQSILKSLPDQAQADFKRVIAMPDVMTLLTDRIDLTVSLGEAYKDNPEDVRQNLTNLNAQITTQNAKDLETYKQEVASDPQLQEEMKKSSADFANAYSETDSGVPPVVNNYYNTTPYPYWSGYPYWYASPIWYPYPLYYHTGFYLGAGGNIVVIGRPSYAYSNWFFGYGYKRYPRMYGRYNAYYNYHYRPNYNVYRGYNSAVRDHFNSVNHIGTVRRGNERRYSSPAQTNPNRGGRSQSPNVGNRSQNFRNSINGSSSFNSQRFNNFQSQQFHQQNWHGMSRSGATGGGGRGGSMGGGRSGGGARRGR